MHKEAVPKGAVFLCAKSGDIMAATYDGSIRINTKIDDLDTSKGLKVISDGLNKFASTANNTFNDMSKYSDKAKAKIESLSSKYGKQTETIEKQKIVLSELKSKMDAINDKTTTPKSITSMEKELKNVQTQIAKLDPQYSAMVEKLGGLETSLAASQGAGDSSGAATYQAQITELDEKLMVLGETLTSLHDKAEMLTSELAKVRLNPSSTNESEKLSSEISLAQTKLERLENEAVATKQKLTSVLDQKSSGTSNEIKKVALNAYSASSAVEKVGKAKSGLDGLGESASRFTQRLKGIVASALIFSVVYKAIQTLTSYLSKALQVNSSFVKSLAQIKGNLLTAFEPVYEAVVPIINTLMQALVKVTSAFAALMSLLFGKTVSGSAAAAKSLNSEVTALDSTGDSAKAASNNLAAFDEINVLSTDSTDSTASTALDTSGTTAADTSEVQGIASSIESLLAPLQSINFDNLTTAFGNLRSAIAPLTQDIFSGLEWAYLNIFVPLASWTITDLLPGFLDLLAAAIDVLTSVIEALEPLGTWLFDNFFEPIAEWTGGAIVTILDGITSALLSFSDWVTNNQGVVQNIAIVIGSFAAAWLLVNGAIAIWNVVGLVAAGVTGIFGAAVAVLTSPITIVILVIGALIAIIILLATHWDEVKQTASDVWDGIVAIWDAVADWFNTNVVTPVAGFFKTMWGDIKTAASDVWNGIVAVWTAVSGWFSTYVTTPVAGFFKTMWDGIKTAATDIWGAVVKVWAVASTWFSDNVTTPVAGFFTALWSGIGTAASDVWNGIVTVWTAVSGWFTDNIITPVESAFGGFRDSIIGIWGEIWSGIKNVINNDFLTGIESFLNDIISGINSFIDMIDEISVKVPDWVTDLTGVTSFGFGISEISSVSLPRLAEGAVIPPNREFVSILGDQKSGTNIEAPTDLIRQIMQEELAKVDSSGTQTTTTINFTGSLAQLGRVLKPVIKTETTRKGTSIVQTATA
jgi:hypothetical protein